MSAIFILVLCIVLPNLGSSLDECVSPRNRKGTCKIIDECGPLKAILDRRPLSAGTLKYLKDFHCGFESMVPKVCCEANYDITAKSPVGSVANFESPANIKLLANISECGIDNTEPRIYGGNETALNAFPWMALLEYERPFHIQTFGCGGSLISDRYVLTAAHCIIGEDIPRSWKLVSVRLGEHNTKTDTDCQPLEEKKIICAPPHVSIPIEEKIIHENYDPTASDTPQRNRHDIALLRLAEKVNFAEHIKPICLPTSARELQKTYSRKRLVVAGWGLTEFRRESDVKRRVSVPLRTNEFCMNAYQKSMLVRIDLNEGQLCAGGEPDRDSCQGDSGGPLMTPLDVAGDTHWFAAGVISYGPSTCGLKDRPSVYTRVSQYITWIVGKLKP